MVAIIWRSCIGNCGSAATCNRISQCMTSCFACFQKGRRTLQKHAASLQRLSSKSAAFLFLRRSEDLEPDGQETLITLRQLAPEIGLAYTLVEQFVQMLRTRTGERLDAWLEQARASQIRELQGFATSVERDKAAVVTGLTLPQNNGLVEGHVNKLKLIKRMGYGRAGISLLRQRVLHAF
jgi:transposase